jgi:lysine-specific demethylase 8
MLNPEAPCILGCGLSKNNFRKIVLPVGLLESISSRDNTSYERACFTLDAFSFRSTIPFKSIEPRSAPSVSDNTAFIIRSEASPWRAFKEWTLEFFSERYGETQITAQGDFRLDKRMYHMPFARFCREMDKKHLYIRQLPLVQLDEALLGHFDLSQFLDSNYKLFPYIWIGPKNTIQTLHKDNHDSVMLNKNLFAQLHGYKYLLLASNVSFSPSAMHWHEGKITHHVRLDPLSEEFFADNLPCGAILEDAILGPGDIAFIPENTWHYVQSLSTSISLSVYWFENPVCELIYGAMDCNSLEELGSYIRSLNRPILDRHLSSFNGLDGVGAYLRGLQSFQRSAIFASIVNRSTNREGR